MKIEIMDEAKLDLAEGFQFYENQAESLGDYFLTSLFSDIDALEDLGGIHEIVHGYHQTFSRKFPFAIYYRVENEIVKVHAVLDCRRDPAWIRNRLN